jgi:hypothetical protein
MAGYNWLDIIQNQAKKVAPRQEWQGTDNGFVTVDDNIWEWTSPEGKKYTIRPNDSYESMQGGGWKVNPKWQVTTDTDAYGNWRTKSGDPRDFITQGIDESGNLVGDPFFHRKNTSFVNFRDSMKIPAAMVASMFLGPEIMAMAEGGGAAGAVAGGLTGWDAAMADLVASASPFGASALPSTAAAGGSLLGGLGDAISSAGSAIKSGIGSLIGGDGLGGLLGNVGVGDIIKGVGAIAGAVDGSKKKDNTATNVKTLDPRIDSRVFGAGGLLENADKWFNANKATGQNETMVNAQNWMRGMLQHPGVQQGLMTMGGRGMNMMEQPVAGNPFAAPGAAWSPLQQGGQQSPPPGMGAPGAGGGPVAGIEPWFGRGQPHDSFVRGPDGMWMGPDGRPISREDPRKRASTPGGGGLLGPIYAFGGPGGVM